MSTLQFLTAMGVIALLFVISLYRDKPQRPRKFPSGRKFFSDTQLLKMSKEDLKLLSKDDLSFLINYVGHTDPESPQKEQWNDLFHRASAVRWGY